MKYEVHLRPSKRLLSALCQKKFSDRHMYRMLIQFICNWATPANNNVQLIFYLIINP